jgi:hypothetical protein
MATVPPTTETKVAESTRTTVAGEFTFELVFDGAALSGHPVIRKFQADNKLGDVWEYVCANVVAVARKKIVFETPLPKQGLGADKFGEFLSTLGFARRAQLFVKAF